MPLDEKFSQRLIRLREKRGWKTAELAFHAGIDVNAVKALESGASKFPTFQNGVLLARALNCDALYLAFGSDVPPQTSDSLSLQMDELLARVEALRKRVYGEELSESS